MLDPSKRYLNVRLAHGVRNSIRLLTEITGVVHRRLHTPNRYLRPLRSLDAAKLAERPAPSAVRTIADSITGLPSNLEPENAERIHAIRQRCPELDAAVGHAWPGWPG